MPSYDDTNVAQPIPRSSPRIYRNLEPYHDRHHAEDGSRDSTNSSRNSSRNEPTEEFYIRRRKYSRDDPSRKEYPTKRHDELIRRPRHRSRSVASSSRRVAFRGEEDHSDGRSDSDSDYKRSRAVTRRKSDRQLKIVPCGEKCADHPNNKANSQRHNRRYDSDSDSDYSSGEEYEKQRKHRNRKLLYTGLACVTTVAAANNIYQNTKAHETRHNAVQEGEMCTSELKRRKKNALLMDVFTAGVIAVGINNARIGWKRVEAIKQEGKGK